MKTVLFFFLELTLRATAFMYLPLFFFSQADALFDRCRGFEIFSRGVVEIRVAKGIVVILLQDTPVPVGQERAVSRGVVIMIRLYMVRRVPARHDFVHPRSVDIQSARRSSAGPFLHQVP